MMRVAGFGAFAANVRATPAVLMLVLATFVRAMATGLFAKREQFVSELAIAGKQARSQVADVRAIPVQLNAMRHRRYITLVKTGGCADLTSLRAIQKLA